MVKSKKYTAAVIGLGRIGFDFQFDSKREQPASHTKTYSSNKNIQLVAGVDTDKNRRDLFVKCYKKAKVFSDVDELFTNCTPDIVSVSVSEESHLGVVKSVISHKPRLVVLEKPVALNVSDANEIRMTAQKFNVPVLVNHNRRFANDYRLTKQLLDDGFIGDVQTCFAKLWAGSIIYSHDRFISGECSLLHDGTHLLDILRFLFGAYFDKPNVVSMRTGEKTFTNEETGEKITEKNLVRYLNLNYDINQVVVNVEISGQKKFFGFELDICGSKGRIVIGNGYYKVYTAQKSPFYDNFVSLVRDYKYKTFKNTHYFANMAQNCVDFLDGKAPLVSTLDDGIGVIEDLTAIVNAIDSFCLLKS